jgi:hypothetical protein
MLRIALALALVALLGSCATYTERTSPCVCAWEPINLKGEAVV